MIGRLLMTGVLLSGGAWAGSPHCHAPVAEWQPREVLHQRLTQEGYRVSRIKVDDGCYEVKALDPQGRKIEAKYDPKSLAPVAIEAD